MLFYFVKGDDGIKVADHLKLEQRKQLEKLGKRKKPPSKKKKRKGKVKQEKVNWNEIMGMNRDTYKRVNGVWKRK